MTGSVTRRGFFKRGGLLLGFVFMPGGVLRVLDARACGEAGDVDLNVWVHVSNSENTITIKCPPAEMGQGVHTTIALLIAEELDADWRTMRVEQAPLDTTFTQPGHADARGAGAIRHYRRAARLAGAQARTILIANAAREWKVAPSECTTEPNNVVHAASGRKISYMEIARFENITLDAPPTAEKYLKPRERWRLLGNDVPRLDVPHKVSGRAKYGIDVQIPGMYFASILHPPVAALPYPLYGDGAENGPLAIDAADALKIEGVVRVVPLPHAVAVVGTDYWATVKGKRALKVEWRKDSLASRYDSEAKKREWATLAADRTQPGRVIGATGDFDTALKTAAQTISADYVSDHAHHACMEPFNATAWMMHGDIELFTPTQEQTLARQSVAQVSGLADDKVRVYTTLVGGGFGAKSEQLANAEAALLSKAMDKPVKVIWSREDDVRHGAYRPLAAQHMNAAIAADGAVIGWSHRVVADSVLSRVDKPGWDKAAGMDGAVAEGLLQPYRIGNRHHEYLHRAGGVPVGYWNAVGNGYTIFAVESFVDEIAAKLGRDPLQMRIDLLADARARAVLERVRNLSGWDRKRSGTALGVAYNHGGSGGGQIAEVVEVSVDRATGAIKVHAVWAAADIGVAIQPRVARQQLESGIIWGLSAALRERVIIRDGEVRHADFDDYPVPRINDIPVIHLDLMPADAGQPAGRIAALPQAPLAPAIANALFRLTGARLRAMPLLAGRVKLALTDARQAISRVAHGA